MHLPAAFTKTMHDRQCCASGRWYGRSGVERRGSPGRGIDVGPWRSRDGDFRLDIHVAMATHGHARRRHGGGFETAWQASASSTRQA
jgi:hypothetical protein